eukprot:484612_1
MLEVVQLYKQQQKNAVKQRNELLNQLELKYKRHIDSLLEQKTMIAKNITNNFDEIISNINDSIFNYLNQQITTTMISMTDINNKNVSQIRKNDNTTTSNLNINRHKKLNIPLLTPIIATKPKQNILLNQKRKRKKKNKKRCAVAANVGVEYNKQPFKKQKTQIKMKQTMSIIGFEYFAFAHKTNDLCLNFNNSFYKTQHTTKITPSFSKSKMFNFPNIIDQMVICFSYIKYLPSHLNANEIIANYDAKTLNIVGKNTINKFIEQYNEKIKLFPKDICIDKFQKIPQPTHEQMLQYMDKIFETQELKKLKYRKQKILKYALERYCKRTKCISELQNVKYDWDREWIYKHYFKEKDDSTITLK